MAAQYELLKELLNSGTKLDFGQEMFFKFYQAFILNDRWVQYIQGVGTTLLVTAIALALGVVLGSVAALNRGKWIDNVIIVIATCGIAVPSFVVCTILLYIFSLKLGWLPSYGLTGWKNYIMPVIALGFYPTAYICRLMRSSMLDVLGQDYMRTARAKGLSQGKSLFKHALRNAILPVVTYLGPALAYTLTGSLIVEKIFTIPGLGDSLDRKSVV